MLLEKNQERKMIKGLQFLLVPSLNYTLVSFSSSNNSFINTEPVSVLAAGIIIMGLVSRRAVHITIRFILERAWQGRVLLSSRQVLCISLTMYNSNRIKDFLLLLIEMFSLKHQTLISTLYGHLQWCGLDYWEIYIICSH